MVTQWATNMARFGAVGRAETLVFSLRWWLNVHQLSCPWLAKLPSTQTGSWLTPDQPKRSVIPLIRSGVHYILPPSHPRWKHYYLSTTCELATSLHTPISRARVTLYPNRNGWRHQQYQRDRTLDNLCTRRSTSYSYIRAVSNEHLTRRWNHEFPTWLISNSLELYSIISDDMCWPELWSNPS